MKTSFFCNADGQPRARLRIISGIQTWSLILLLVIPIICFSLVNEWNKTDDKYCPKIIECEDPCIVEADPDIAGIGVSYA